jgi:hypothetical protein
MATPDTTRKPRRVCQHRRRIASSAALSVVAALALAVTGNAFAGGSDSLSDPSAGLPDAGATSNGASSGQPANDASSLEAATQQAASAIADASQNNVQNIVIVIRINSPGDDVISQNNTAAAGAVATNTSTTEQEVGVDVPNDQADSTASTDTPAEESAPTSASNPSAADEPPAATLPPRVAARGEERLRPRVTAVSHTPRERADESRRAAGAARAPAAQVETGTKPNQSSATPAEFAPRLGSEATPRSPSAASAPKSRLSVTPVPARIRRVAVRAGAGAAHFVSSLAPSPTVAGSSAGNNADNVSTAVVITLLAALLGVGSTYVPAVRRRVWR